MLRLIPLALAFALCSSARADGKAYQPADPWPLCQAYAGQLAGRRDGKDLIITCPLIRQFTAIAAEKFAPLQTYLEQTHEMLLTLSHSRLADVQHGDWSAGCEVKREAGIVECLQPDPSVPGLQYIVRYSFDAEGEFQELKLVVPTLAPVFQMAPGEVYQPLKDMFLDLVIAMLQANALPNESIGKNGPGLQVVFKAVKTG